MKDPNERGKGRNAKLRELEARETDLALRKEEFEEWKLLREKELEEREKLVDGREHEVGLRDEKLKIREEILEFMTIMLERSYPDSLHEKDYVLRKSIGSAGSPSGFPGMEVGESSTPQAQLFSDSLRNVPKPMDQKHDSLSFSLTIAAQHKDQHFMLVPSSFASAFDWTRKEKVIMYTNEGSFPLKVEHSRFNSAQVFFNGWSDFHRMFRLRTGKRYVFKVKELEVEGDASVFSMDVSMISG